jgi:hypothetical protein
MLYISRLSIRGKCMAGNKKGQVLILFPLSHKGLYIRIRFSKNPPPNSEVSDEINE